MLLLSARAGALAQRIGPRMPMTIGPLVVAVGMVLLGAGRARHAPTGRRCSPALLVLGLGLSLTVAPLTATVLGAVEDAHAGIASAINNSVARIAGLLAVAVLPGGGRAHRRAGPRPRRRVLAARCTSPPCSPRSAVCSRSSPSGARCSSSRSLRGNPAIPCYDGRTCAVAGSRAHEPRRTVRRRHRDPARAAATSTSTTTSST